MPAMRRGSAPGRGCGAPGGDMRTLTHETKSTTERALLDPDLSQKNLSPLLPGSDAAAPPDDPDDPDADDTGPAPSISMASPDDGWTYPFEEAEFTRIVPAIIGTAAGGDGAGAGGAGRGTVVFAAPPQASPGWASADDRRVVGSGGASSSSGASARKGRGRGGARAPTTASPDGGAIVLNLDDSTPVLAMEIGGDALLAMLLSNASDRAGRKGGAAGPPAPAGGGPRPRTGGRRRRGAPAPPRRRLPPLALEILAAVLARAGKDAPGGLGEAGRKAAPPRRRPSAAAPGGGAHGGGDPAPPPKKHKRQAWGLVRAAIVDHDATTGAFIGRLFFGDPATGAVAWECEARPADATWLADRAGAPLLVRRDLFAGRAVPLGTLIADGDDDDGDDDESDDEDGEDSDGGGSGGGSAEDGDGGRPGRGPGGRGRRRRRGRAGRGGAGGVSPHGPPPRSGPAFTGPAAIRPGDPPAVVLLKRQLAVAVVEEDYGTAAALRDLPVMRAAAVAAAATDAGDAAGAAVAEAELAALIEAGELQGEGEGEGGADQQEEAPPPAPLQKRRGRPPKKGG